VGGLGVGHKRGAGGGPVEIVYGPVSSWRLGRSLGIDPICGGAKVCSFDCIYCSLGPTIEKTIERRVFVSAKQAARALENAVKKVEADVVTFSGMGEPTLAKNLGELVEVARNISDLPIAVLSNSSLWFRRDVRKDLARADVVKGKLDVPSEELLMQINRPDQRVSFSKIMRGLQEFRQEFSGRLALEIMFVPENKDFSGAIAKVVKTIEPDEVQINTPLRPNPTRPLTREELKEVQKSFRGMNFRTVYEAEKSKIRRVVGEKKIKRLKRAD
jgi:wyosine [tRNA(Phe)-imidazoG37] synthetase (radical SAM superfamily)